jgi:hypothetical protein
MECKHIIVLWYDRDVYRVKQVPMDILSTRSPTVLFPTECAANA